MKLPNAPVNVYSNTSKEVGVLPKAATSLAPNMLEAFIEPSPTMPKRS